MKNAGNMVSEVANIIRSLRDSDKYLFVEDGLYHASNEWLCGTFGGRTFQGSTEEEAVENLIEYLDLHNGHNSIVGSAVTKSGWGDLKKVKKYLGIKY